MQEWLTEESMNGCQPFLGCTSLLSTGREYIGDHCKCQCSRNNDLAAAIVQLNDEDLKSKKILKHPLCEGDITDDIDFLTLPQCKGD